MGSITVNTKIFNAIYLGTSTITINSTTCAWITNVIKIIRPSLATGINTRQSFNGAFNGATSGGAVTTLVPNTIYEFTCGNTNGWSLPDFSFYPVSTSTSNLQPVINNFSPSSIPKGGQIVIIGTNFTGVTQVSINSAAVKSFTIDSPTQITATLTSDNISGRIKVTDPQNGTATSAIDLTVTIPLTTYTIPDTARADVASVEYGVDNAPIYPTFSSVSFTTAASVITLDLSSSIYLLGSSYSTSGVGVWINGTFSRLAFTADGQRHLVSIPNLPAGTNTIRVEMPDQVRHTIDTNKLVGTSFYAVNANSTLSFINESIPDTVQLVIGDSISGGGGATEQFTDAWTELLRKRNKGTIRTRMQTVSGGSLEEVYGSTSDRSSYVNRIKTLLNGTTKNTLIIQYITNSAGRGNRDASVFGSIYGQLLTDIQASGITNLEIVSISATPVTNYQSTLNIFDTQLLNAVANNSAVKQVKGSDLITVTDLADNVHPTTAGHVKYESNYYASYKGNITADATFINSEFVQPAVSNPQNGWVTGQGCSIANGLLTFTNASFDGSTVGNTRQSVVMTVGNTYRLQMNISGISGGKVEVRTATGGNGQITEVKLGNGTGRSAGLYYIDFTCDTATEVFTIQGLESANATVDYVRLNPIAVGTAPPAGAGASGGNGTATPTQLVINSEFNNPAVTDPSMGWLIRGNQVAIANGTAQFTNATGVNNGELVQNLTGMIVGVQYKLAYNISSISAGDISLQTDSGSNGQFHAVLGDSTNTVGLKTKTFTASTTSDIIYLRGSNGATGVVDYVTITRV